MGQLEDLLNQVTSPSNKSFDSGTFKLMTELINGDPIHEMFTLKILAHKIQSPQEMEALNALSVLELLASNSTNSFRVELGKFRFLNELIKVLIPQYLGDQTSTAVKNKCIQLLHKWQRDFSSSEPKFSEVYNMLRKQGIINDESINNVTIHQTTNRDHNPQRDIFDSNKHSAKLTRLLRSSNPFDVKEANRLIRTIVEEDNRRSEQVTQRSADMEALKNNSLLLDELISTFAAGSSSSTEVELMTELAENIRKARPVLYQLPLTHQENDLDALNEIAVICERASSVLSHYEAKVRSASLIHLPEKSVGGLGHSHGPPVAGNGSPAVVGGCSIDALLSGTPDGESTALASPTHYQFGDSWQQQSAAPTSGSGTSSAAADLIDVFISQLPAMGQTFQPPTSTSKLADVTEISRLPQPTSGAVDSKFLGLGQAALTSSPPLAQPKPRNPFSDLDSICRQMMSLSNQPEKSPDSESPSASRVVEVVQEQDDLLVSVLPPDPGPQAAGGSTPGSNSDPTSGSTPCPTSVEWSSLDVALSSIQPHPGRPSPLRLFPRDGDQSGSGAGLQVHLHYTANRPRPDVLVFVSVATNQATSSVSDLQTRFATSKPFQLRQLPASGTHLPAHSPFLPSAAVSQILLLRTPTPNCQKEVIFPLKFLLSFSLDDGETIFETIQLDLPTN